MTPLDILLELHELYVTAVNTAIGLLFALGQSFKPLEIAARFFSEHLLIPAFSAAVKEPLYEHMATEHTMIAYSVEELAFSLSVFFVVYACFCVVYPLVGSTPEVSR